MRLAAPRLLTPVLQDYAWGSATAIARIRGVEPSGDPEAELWFGAHPKAPSTIDGQPLDVLLENEPDLVGSACVDRFGPGLPYLLKILAADQPLSLQSHPSRDQAEAGFAREEADGIARNAPDRNYRDDWPKPEMLVALEPTEALCGFRDPAESATLLAQLAVAGLDELIAPLGHDDHIAAVRETFLGFLQLDQDHRGVVDRVVEAARAVDEVSPYGRLCATAVELAAFYPGDPGVLAALLMNRIHLEPYQGVFLPAGNMHAYLSGVGVEIMANSDNVLRGGLTPKHVDVDELASVVDFAPGFPGVVEPTQDSSGRWRYDTPAPEFALWRLGGDSTELPQADLGRIVLAIDPVTLTFDGSQLELGRGAGAFLSAGVAANASCEGVAFLAGPGLR